MAAPASARCRAMAAPIPLEAPVTMATLLLSLLMLQFPPEPWDVRERPSGADLQPIDQLRPPKTRTKLQLHGSTHTAAEEPAMSGSATPDSVVAQLVETMRTLAGSHPGFRPAHAKGIV